MKMKSDFPKLSVIGNPEYALLRENMDLVINDLHEAGCITEIRINDIILAFEASGYRVVKDETLPKYVIGSPPEEKR